jgi:CDP-glucose 4,6-dehydratase
MSEARPEVLIHMAAQPLVRYSYANPVETYATNVMGTVHVLESARATDTVRSTVIVTTDKCYENKERDWGYRENEPMGGYDPYSNSKGCAELVTSAYRQSFFSSPNSVNKIASARAGNVIGGGDWSQDRLIPDAIKAFEASKPLMIRNPLAMRPWQHVLEPLSGYLILAQALFEQGSTFASAWNFGPNERDNRSVQEVVELMIHGWGDSARWEKEGSEQPHEANLLSLDCSKAQTKLGWIPRWNLEIATKMAVQWQNAFQAKKSMRRFSLAQIDSYINHKL